MEKIINGFKNVKKSDVLFATKALLKRMVIIAMADKDGGANLVSVLSVGRAKKVNKPESKYGFGAG